ncbi:hypothetical protein ANAEL_03096 [Anaerolineales bacterium]|nr:hypothetical protein ANAEL_03096 [Anaerolineales bacterium]
MPKASRPVLYRHAAIQSLPSDSFAHDALAFSLLEAGTKLRPGAAIAIQGSWGRGKTDVLARIAQLTESQRTRVPRVARPVLWINPWQYSTADLLTPLVVQLLSEMPGSKSPDRAQWRQAAKTVLRAGFSFGLKAASITVPGGSLLDTAREPVDALLENLFDAEANPRKVIPDDADPVAVMGVRFSELIDASITAANRSGADRIVVCVDDLDRCLPERQIAMLEALHFLLSAGARCIFYVGIDEGLVAASARVHYQSDTFDADLYLDKMFDLRVSLPGLTPEDISMQIEGYLAQGNRGEVLEEWIPKGELTRLTSGIFAARRLRNPRVIRRILDRMYILAASGEKLEQLGRHAGFNRFRAVMAWMAISECWPRIRAYLQQRSTNPSAFKDVTESLIGWLRPATKSDLMTNANILSHPGALQALPPDEERADLRSILSAVQELDPTFGFALGLDRMLHNCGI